MFFLYWDIVWYYLSHAGMISIVLDVISHNHIPIPIHTYISLFDLICISWSWISYTKLCRWLFITELVGVDTGMPVRTSSMSMNLNIAWKSTRVKSITTLRPRYREFGMAHSYGATWQIPQKWPVWRFQNHGILGIWRRKLDKFVML